MATLVVRAILDTKDDIFRDIEVPENATLEDLHHAIVAAFGIAPGEMASFFTTNEQWDQLDEIPLVSLGEGEATDQMPQAAMGTRLVHGLLGQRGQRLLYVYDFLSLWTFFVEHVSEGTQSGLAAPAVIMAYGTAPKEAPSKDFGGDSGRSGGDPFDDEDEDDDDEFGFNDDEFDESGYTTEEW
jgi:hypothetical protein